MRTALLAALLAVAALPSAADPPIVSGADLIARCAMPDAGNQTLCNLYLDDVVRRLDWPDRGFGLKFPGDPVTHWDACPRVDDKNFDWHRILPLTVARYWREDTPDPQRLTQIGWRAALLEALRFRYRYCIDTGAT